MKKNLYKLLSLCLLLLSLAGCKKHSIEQKAHVLNMNLTEDPTSFDPRVVRSLRDLTVVKQMYDGLMRLDQTGAPQPAVAKEVVVSEDGCTYTFYLKETLWSNGEKVTSSDFIRSWKKVLDPHFATDYSHMLYPIKNAKLAKSKQCSLDEIGVKALDENTLVVELESPTPYFLELTAFPTYFPFYQDTNELICNGPFCIESWKPQVELILKKNPHYWDALSVKLEGICFTILEDSSTQSYLFKKGELDWLGQPVSNNITADVLSMYKDEGKVESYPVSGTYWFVFNTQKEPFNDSKLRRAFSLAINRQEIIEHILQGHQLAATSPVPPYLFEHKKAYFEDDIEEARKLFKEVMEDHQWSQQNFPKITFKYFSSEKTVKIVQLVQQQWQEAFNIPINLEVMEYKVYRGRLKDGDYQVGPGEWIADYNDPIAFLELFKEQINEETGCGMNDSRWYDAEYVSLLEKASHEVDPLARKELLKQAEAILVNAMPIAPLYHYAFDYVKTDAVRNTVLSSLGIADFKYCSKN